MQKIITYGLIMYMSYIYIRLYNVSLQKAHARFLKKKDLRTGRYVYVKFQSWPINRFNSQYLHCQQMTIHAKWILNLLRKILYLVKKPFKQEFDFMVIVVGPCTFQKLRWWGVWRVTQFCSCHPIMKACDDQLPF